MIPLITIILCDSSLRFSPFEKQFHDKTEIEELKCNCPCEKFGENNFHVTMTFFFEVNNQNYRSYKKKIYISRYFIPS